MRIFPVLPKNNIILNAKYKKRISFKSNDGSSVPIYQIDKQGNYIKKDSLTQAAKEIDVSSSVIWQCINGITRQIKGYSYIRADEVEIKKSDGTIIVDKNIIEQKAKDIIKKTPRSREYRTVFELEIPKHSVQNSKSKPIYIIDFNGDYIKVDAISVGAKILNLPLVSIHSALNGVTKTARNFIIKYADDVEIMTQDGIVLDKQKIDECARDLHKFSKNNTKITVYTFDEDGNFTKYNSLNEIAEKFNCSIDCVKRAFETGRAIQGLFIVKASEVEDSEEGRFYLKKSQAIKNALQRTIDDSKAIYAINVFGEFKKFDSISIAAKALGFKEARVSSALNGHTKTCGGYVFVRAKDVEYINKNNEIKVDLEKIRKLNKV